MPERTLLFLGAVFGFLAVALGAFGAHALRDALSPELLDVFETGVRYHMFHAIALLAAAFVAAKTPSRLPRAAGWLFAAGIVVFSGSLYTLALTGARSWGAVTPFGGVTWLVAWGLLAASAFRAK